MHTLTELIAKEIGQGRSTWEARDEIITSWLREKAKVLRGWIRENVSVESILGLEGEQEEVIGGSGVYPKTLRSEPPKDKLGEWCEHMDNIYTSFHKSEWILCPICGTPRPVARSLEDEFLSIFKIHNNQYSSAKEWRKVVVKELASIARKWYEGK